MMLLQRRRLHMCRSCSIIHSLLLILFLTGCAGAEMQDLPSEYFPLKVGLQWKYLYKGMPREPVEVDVRITEEKKIEGRNYFHFSTWFDLTRNVADEDVWISWDHGTIYRWDGKNETKVFAPMVKKAELTKNDPGVQIETPAGKFSDVYRFNDCPGCADAGSEFIFARDVGIISVSMSAIWGGASYELTATNANEH